MLYNNLTLSIQLKWTLVNHDLPNHGRAKLNQTQTKRRETSVYNSNLMLFFKVLNHYIHSFIELTLLGRWDDRDDHEILMSVQRIAHDDNPASSQPCPILLFQPSGMYGVGSIAKFAMSASTLTPSGGGGEQ